MLPNISHHLSKECRVFLLTSSGVFLVRIHLDVNQRNEHQSANVCSSLWRHWEEMRQQAAQLRLTKNFMLCRIPLSRRCIISSGVSFTLDDPPPNPSYKLMKNTFLSTKKGKNIPKSTMNLYADCLVTERSYTTQTSAWVFIISPYGYSSLVLNRITFYTHIYWLKI